MNSVKVQMAQYLGNKESMQCTVVNDMVNDMVNANELRQLPNTYWIAASRNNIATFGLDRCYLVSLLIL